MAWMLIAGVVLLVLAGVAAYLAVAARKRIQRMTMTETVTAAHLVELHAAAVSAGAADAFHEVVEVTGVVRPGPSGLLASPLSHTDCVWHRHEVRRRFREHCTDSKGNRRTRTSYETVSEHTSTDPFQVEDPSGRVLVHPSGAVDRPHQVFDRFVEPEGRDRAEGAGTRTSLGALISSLAERDDTIGFQHSEWALKDGARVYVLAEATDADGSLCLRKPRDGTAMIVSTRTEEELSQAAGQHGMLYSIAAAAGLVVGLVLIVLGMVL